MEQEEMAVVDLSEEDEQEAAVDPCALLPGEEVLFNEGGLSVTSSCRLLVHSPPLSVPLPLVVPLSSPSPRWLLLRDGRRLPLPSSLSPSFLLSLSPPSPSSCPALSSRSLLPRSPELSLLPGLGPLPLSFSPCDANSSFSLCPSYPPLLVLPSSLASSPSDLASVARFRSRSRLPVLSWCRGPHHPALLLRSAQPRRGLLFRASPPDAALFAALPQLLLFDARSRVAALANAGRGGGTEPARGYGRLLFGDMANIHTIRKDHTTMVNSFHSTKPSSPLASSLSSLSSPWLEHVRALLSSSFLVSRHLASNLPAAVHCSDGWDRTAQICGLVALLVDERARSLVGFLRVVMREWVLMGHRFSTRLGLSPHPKEEAPVFLLFLDGVHQLLRVAPNAFEFRSSLLVAMMDAAYSGRFGTFLFDSEQERALHGAHLAPCFLTWALLRRSSFVNSSYAPVEGLLDMANSPPQPVLWKEWFMRYL